MGWGRESGKGELDRARGAVAVYYGDFDVSGLEGVSDGLEVKGAVFEVSVEGVHGLAAGGYDHGIDIGDVAGGPGDDVVDVEGVFENFKDSGEGCHLDALAEQAFVEVLPERRGYLPAHVLETGDDLDGLAAGRLDNRRRWRPREGPGCRL